MSEIYVNNIICNELYVQEFTPAQLPAALTILLHGFPGEEKNEDLAHKLCSDLGHKVYIPHHAGLGKSSGQFSFLKSIETGISLVNSLAEKNNDLKLNIFGHSWGGLIAINATKYCASINKLALAAPFNTFPQAPMLIEIIKMYRSEHEEIFKNYSTESILADINQVLDQFDPKTSILEIDMPSNRILIIQGLQDETVLASHTKEFATNATTGANYIELNDDHKFTLNRSSFLCKVKEFFED